MMMTTMIILSHHKTLTSQVAADVVEKPTLLLTQTLIQTLILLTAAKYPTTLSIQNILLI